MSQAWGDYSGSAVAVDGSEGVIVVWSEYRSDRWRLMSRRLDLRTGRWSTEKYVAPAGRRQLFPRMATDAAGRACVVWQEFVEGSFGIFLSNQESESAWSKPIQVSQSKSNQWEPAIAAAPDGSVWVAWDGYNNGNYDIFLRRFRNGRAEGVIQVTSAPTRDAHASLAVDSRNQVWLAWEEAGPNWGKDSGVLIRTGEALHASRSIRLVRYANGAFTEPVKPLEQSLPSWVADYQEYPHLAIDTKDVPRLFFRHFLFLRGSAAPGDPPQMRFGPEERLLEPFPDVLEQMFNVFVTGFDGSDWLPARPVPESWGRCNMQTGSAAQGDKVVYLWPSDGRSYEDRHLRTAQLRYADFQFDGKLALSERMRPFVSKPAVASDAAFAEKRDSMRVRATRWQDRRPLRLFRGELHRHTDISTDGRLDGDVLDAYRYALDAASLDFMAVTEHTFHERLNYFRYDWWRSRQVASMFNNPGYFASLFGYERTVTYPGGHRNIISTRRDLQPVPIADEEYYGVQSYGERLYPNLLKNGDIAIAHTTSADGGTDWRDWNRQAEPVVEIFQGLRGSYEEPDGPGAARSIKMHPEGYVWRAWEKNRRVGVIASSDHNSTHQSFACVYAPELTPQAILDAIKKRRTFAATDNIVVKLEAVDAGGTVWKMGQEFKAGSPPELRVQIEGTDVLSKIELIRNGKFVLVRQPGKSEDRFRYRDTEAASGTACYSVRLTQANRMIAWSSPIWVDFGLQ